VAHKDKPYRVYRGGRAKGPIRHETAHKEAKSRKAARRGTDGRESYPGPAAKPRPRWRRRILIALGLVVIAFLVWAVLGYLAFRRGVEHANERIDPRAVRALSAQEGSMLSNPSTILLLGADVGGTRKNTGSARADSIMIVRTDPDEHRIAFLSIPRDLRVDIPGHGTQKINAAYAFGGPTLTVKTVQRVTGLPLNHVVVVDFGTFADVIDALGGVTIDVPKPILSNAFECPKSTVAECNRWRGWRFEKGEQTMGGRRALIYSRIRENQLDPSENDLTRGARQQAVLQAVTDEVVSFGTFLRAPFIGDDLVDPLATDLSANQLLQLGWVKFRTPSSGRLNCRLGGTPATIDGQSFIVGTEENVSVIAMVTGKSAPQPPPPGSGAFGPGCVVGR
jgi:polyisoprenyl-teichoic acid--peptidoglycan teichoic acid transferase